MEDEADDEDEDEDEADVDDILIWTIEWTNEWNELKLFLILYCIWFKTIYSFQFCYFHYFANKEIEMNLII